MTVHEAIYAPAGLPVLTACLLLLTLQMAVIFASYRSGRSRSVRILQILWFAAGFLLFYLPMLDICWEHDHSDLSVQPPALLRAFGSLPLSRMILAECLFALVLLAELLGLIRYRKTHPTPGSIKESMDLLPAGIAYAKPDGTAVFSNLVMNGLSRAVTGKDFTDCASLGLSLEPGEETQIALPGSGEVWQFSENAAQVDGEPYLQMTAAEITRQAAVTQELEQRNEKLRDLHMRLDLYNRQADRIIIAQELLTARMAVHNEVGNVLLESRHYLRDPASFDEGKLLQALKNTNTYLLREYEQDDTGRDPLTESMETADAIGVDVLLSGPIPAKDPYRAVLAAAIRECATNTVKHANGDSLSVQIRDHGAFLSYRIESGGEAPKGVIRESGGLLSLRTLVEKENGTMRTDASPAFTLTIRLPKEDRT